MRTGCFATAKERRYIQNANDLHKVVPRDLKQSLVSTPGRRLLRNGIILILLWECVMLTLARPHWRKTQILQNWLAEFEERQSSCVHSAVGNEKFVLVRKEAFDGGIGNQLPCHITGLLLALVTKRCLFTNSAIFLRFFSNTAAYDWEAHEKHLTDLGHNVSNIYELDPNSADGLSPWLLQNQTALYEQHHGIVLANDFDYSAPFLLANPMYRDMFSKAFPHGEAFWALSSFLLKVPSRFLTVNIPFPPLQTVSHAARTFKGRSFKQLNIGMQIRRKKCMLECLHPPCQYEPEVNSTGCQFLPSVKHYASVAKALQIVRDVPDDDTAFFVATDDTDVYDQVAGLLGNASVIYRKDSGIEKVNPSGNPDIILEGSIKSGLVDMILLSECDEMVMTGSSTFGSTAAGWGGIAPVVMIPGLHLDIDNPFWYKSLNSEPCVSKGYSLVMNGFLTGTFQKAAMATFKASPFWTQSLQCHSSMSHYF